MSPDDPRHGTYAGYTAGCRSECCRAAARLYHKVRTLEAMRGLPRMVSSRGARRRVEALACLGWSSYDVAAELGNTGEWTRQVLMRDVIFRSTHEAIAAVYDDLSTRTPQGRPQILARTRNRARRLGYLPPAAWDDIDNDPEPPTGEPVELDEVVVERILDGERLEATQEEKAEVVRRWLAAGRPLAHLEAQTGWNGNRERLRATQKGVA